MIAFTVPIVVNNFSLYYAHAQTRSTSRRKQRAFKLLNKMSVLTTFVPTLDEIKESVSEERRRKIEKSNSRIDSTGKLGEKRNDTVKFAETHENINDSEPLYDECDDQNFISI